MRIINIIEIVDNNVQGIESFGVVEEQLKEDVVAQAEYAFKLKAIENGIMDDDLESAIENGVYENGTYTLNLVWSDIDN
jgi:hypothetical protein